MFSHGYQMNEILIMRGVLEKCFVSRDGLRLGIDQCTFAYAFICFHGNTIPSQAKGIAWIAWFGFMAFRVKHVGRSVVSHSTAQRGALGQALMDLYFFFALGRWSIQSFVSQTLSIVETERKGQFDHVGLVWFGSVYPRGTVDITLYCILREIASFWLLGRTVHWCHTGVG